MSNEAIDKDIERVLNQVTDSKGSPQYEDIRNALLLMSKTEEGRKIIKDFPDDVDITCCTTSKKPSLDGRFAAYDDGKLAIKPLTKEYSCPEEFASILAHEMIHAKQDDAGDSYCGTDYTSFAGNKLTELETLIRETELQYDLRYTVNDGKSPPLETADIRIYKKCLEKARAENPNGTDDEIKRAARTQMAQTFWTCNTDLSDDPTLQARIVSWNTEYDIQSSRECRQSSFFRSFLGFFGFGKFDKSDATEVIDRMGIDVSPEFFTEKPANLELNLEKGKDFVRQIDPKGQTLSYVSFSSGKVNCYLPNGTEFTDDPESAKERNIRYIQPSEERYSGVPSKALRGQPKKLANQSGAKKKVSAKPAEVAYVPVDQVEETHQDPVEETLSTDQSTLLADSQADQVEEAYPNLGEELLLTEHSTETTEDLVEKTLQNLGEDPLSPRQPTALTYSQLEQPFKNPDKVLPPIVPTNLTYADMEPYGNQYDSQQSDLTQIHVQQSSRSV